MPEEEKTIKLKPEFATLIWRALHQEGRPEASLFAARMIFDEANLIGDEITAEETLAFWKDYLIAHGYLEETSGLMH